MKNSFLTTVLLVLLAISAVWSVILCMQFNNHTREIRQLSAQAAVIQARRVAFQSLAVETQEYARTNPAIDPILKSIGIVRATPAHAAGAPQGNKQPAAAK